MEEPVRRRLAVFGATGRTGRHVVEMALGRGFEVTTFVRDAGKLDDAGRVQVVVGDVTTDEEAVAQAVRGQDAVISALGRGQSFKSEGLMEKASRALVEAMEKENVKRLVYTSAFGLGDTREGVPFLSRLFRDTLLRDIYADKEAGEALVRRSNLDWTFVHPTGLTNGPVTGTYRAAPTLSLRGLPRISRADVAHFLLSQVDDDSYVRKTALISD
jgi:putative NADH-flavin reductase